MKLIKTIVKNFLRHRGTDLAAGLTYYAVFAIFPALLALLSLLSVIGRADSARQAVLDVLDPLLSDATMSDIEPTVRGLTVVQGAPLVLAFGAALALYSASGYVAAFGRAMNTVREVEETRPFWKLRPLIVLVTLVIVVLNAVGLVIVVATGPIARSLGDKLGVGNDVLDIWDIAKWPGLAVLVVVVVALLYQVTPNVKFGRVRILTVGAFLALLLWAGASTGFAFYVANFSSYNKTYGSIAGVVVGLLWLWLTNLALIFGAEIDAARDHRKAAHAAMAAEPGPTEVVHPGAAGSSAVVAPAAPMTSVRRRDRGKVAESFPQKAGEPPYGPITQPVPDED